MSDVLLVNCGTAGDHGSGVLMASGELPDAMAQADADNAAADATALAMWHLRQDAQAASARQAEERAAQQRTMLEPLVATIQDYCSGAGAEPAIVAIAKLLGIVPME